MSQNLETINNLELVYTSPESMLNPDQGVPALEIDGFSGILAEYVIKADLIVNTVPNEDSSLIIRINNENDKDKYISMEHIHGVSTKNMIHGCKINPTKRHGGLLMTRTHDKRPSIIKGMMRLRCTDMYPKITLETMHPTMIFSNREHWIQQDLCSSYDSPIPEINTMRFYTYPVNLFHGILQIYKKIENY